MNIDLEPKFSLGMTVLTPGVEALLKFPNMPGVELSPLINRHQSGDWGDMPPEDKLVNNAAIETLNRIFSCYQLNGTTVWIITDAGHGVTTVLLPDEY